MTGYCALSFAFSEACVGSKIDNAAAFARGAARAKRLAADKNFMPVSVVVGSGKLPQIVNLSGMCSRIAPKECVLLQKGMELGGSTEIEVGVRRKRCHLMTPPHVIPGADLYPFLSLCGSTTHVPACG